MANRTKRMSQMEVDLRQALGDLNNNGVDLLWLVTNMKQSYDQGLAHKERLYAQINLLRAVHKELLQMAKDMDIGDECPQGMGTLMVNNQAYQKLRLKLERLIRET